MRQIVLDQGVLNLEIGNCRITGWRPGLWLDGRHWEATDLALEQISDSVQALTGTFAGGAVRLNARILLSAPGAAAPELVVEGVLHNESDAVVRLGRVELFHAERVRIPGPAAELLHLPRAGVIQPRMVIPFASRDCPRSSKIKGLYYHPAGPDALLVGFDTFGRCDTMVETDADEHGRMQGMRAVCDFAGWALRPGCRTSLERLCLSSAACPHQLLEEWAERAAAACTPAPRQWEEAPLGWLGWSWVDPFNVECYEEVMVRNCGAIRERLRGHDIRYIWLSIGNLADGSPGAWLEWNYRHFPSGPEALAAKLRELGFRLGLWCAPFYICSALADLVAELDEAGALLYRDGERMVVCERWRYGRFGNLPAEQRPCLYALDPTHPRSLSFIRETFSTYRRWGIRYYMIDFLNAGAGNIGPYPYDACRSQDLVPGPEAYRQFLRVIRNACGDDTYLLSSSGPTIHNAGIVDAVRTGNDFGEGRQISPDSFFYPASYVINHEGFWTGPLYALRNQACSYYTHRTLYLNDSGNVLTVDSPLPLEDARIHAAIHTLGGSPSMFGDDVERMAPDRLQLLRQTLPRPRTVAFPVDLFECAYPDHPKLFRHTVNKSWGRFHIVAVYNFTPDALRQSLEWAHLGLEDRAHHVWEFFNQQYVGTFDDSVGVVVPPGSVRIFRLTPDERRPAIVGSDMHLLMGEMEIIDMAWNAKTRTLAGRAWRPKSERGHLFVHAPRGLAVQEPRGLWIAKDGRNETLVIKLQLDFSGGEADWAVQFTSI